jgi:hypothetical protein
MDIGSSGSTSFEYDDSIVDLYDKKPELEKCQNGLIHSHNTMNAYFSGVDDSEIHDNAANYNGYLSVVVNNKLEFAARLAWVGKFDSSRNVNIEGFNLFPEKEETEALFILELEKVEDVVEVNDDVFMTRLEEVKEEDKVSKQQSYSNVYPYNGTFYNSPYPGSSKRYMGFNVGNNNKSLPPGFRKQDYYNPKEVRTQYYSSIKTTQACKEFLKLAFDMSSTAQNEKITFNQILEKIEDIYHKHTNVYYNLPKSMIKSDFLVHKKVFETIPNESESSFLLATLVEALIEVMQGTYYDRIFKNGFKFTSRLISVLKEELETRKKTMKNEKS